MDLEQKPQSSLAAKVLPAALYRALTHVFAEGLPGLHVGLRVRLGRLPGTGKQRRASTRCRVQP